MSIMQTYSGVAWDLLNPHHSNIFLCDILTALERTNRFSGNSKRPLSVLKHSLLVAKLASDEAKPWALLHDVHEAYLGDMTTPVAQAIEGEIKALEAYPDFSWAWTGLKNKHDIQIWKAFGLGEPSAAIKAEIKRADLQALASEKEYFLHPQRDKSLDIWGDLPEPCAKQIAEDYYGLSSTNARKEFSILCELYGMTLPLYPPDLAPDQGWL